MTALNPITVLLAASLLVPSAVGLYALALIPITRARGDSHQPHVRMVLAAGFILFAVMLIIACGFVVGRVLDAIA